MNLITLTLSLTAFSASYNNECYLLDYGHYDYDFDSYLEMYNKTYSDKKDYYMRENIYYQNINYINMKNSQNLTYTLGVNQFTDMTQEEFHANNKGYLGFYLDDLPDYPQHHYTITNTPIQSVDWRAAGQVTNIKDQSQCGSCWAFSAVATMEGAIVRNGGSLTSLSEQDLVDCVPDCYGCDGGWPLVAIDWVINGSLHNNSYNEGNNSNLSMIDTEMSYPYLGVDNTCNYSSDNRGGNITGIITIPQDNVALLQDALLSVGPISVAIDAEDDFQFYKSGIYESTSCSQTELDHAVTAVGFGETPQGKKYYIIKNSWGTDWGEDGYIYFSADIPNMCGIAYDACYAT